MATHVVSREVESRAVGEFLASVLSGPSALVVEGEAGIGKTTVWLAAIERAQEAGFQVLSTRAAQTESVLAYTSLAALLNGLDDAAIAELPPPQRLAIDRVLLRASANGPVTDQRAVGAGFVSLVQRLADGAPVLVAIDDLQWIDAPSRMIISSATRRLAGPIGVLATVRDGPEYADAGSWLELRRPDRLRRIRVRPLSLGATHAVLSERLGRSFPVRSCNVSMTRWHSRCALIAGHAAMVRTGPRGVGPGQRDPDPSRTHGLGEACRRARGHRYHESGDGGRIVHQPQKRWRPISPESTESSISTWTDDGQN